MGKKKDKTLKKQRRLERERALKKKKVYTYSVYTVLSLIVFYLVYLWISSALAPQYIPEVEDRPFTGPEDADVVFFEFGCFTCPLTRDFNLNIVPTLIEEYSDKVKFVFSAAPIYSNPGAEDAAIAGYCANEQDLFWDYAERLFRLNSYDRASLIREAEALDMDINSFSACIDERRYADQVRRDHNDRRKARIGVTPTVFVNNVKIDGAVDLNIYRRLLDDKLSEYETPQNI